MSFLIPEIIDGTFSTMVSVNDLFNVCRLCLKAEQSDISTFFTLGSNNSDLLDKISVCLPVQVSTNDNLPQKVCLSCYKSVDFVYNFWQVTSNSEKQLQKMLNNLKESETHDISIQNADIDWTQDNSLMLYDTLSDKDIVLECKDLNGENNSNIEIKEVYFGDFVSQNEYIEEDVESVIIKKAQSDIILEDSSIIQSEPNVIVERSISEETQISQIVESSNVSLRTFEEDDSLKLKFWDVTLPDFFLIPYNYQPEKSIEPNTVVLMDIHNPPSTIPVENKSFACNVCQMTFTDQLSFLKHYENVHRLFKCPFCVKYFRRRYILENHLVVHTTRKEFSCPICKMKFKRQSNVRQHIQRMHSFYKDVGIFECAECSYKTKTKRLIRLHVQSHMGIVECVCDICGKAFNTNLDLNVHRNNHLGIKPYQCDVCGSHFTRKHYMLTHRRLLHEETYSYQCDVCGRAFSYMTSLKAHLKLHTGENRVKCDICHKIVSSKLSLENHKKMHTDSKEFVCGICGKKYINKYSLQEHLLVHTGSKPFQCLQCDKTFSTRKKLLHHEQIHDADRSIYPCSQCHKSYFSKFKLKEHFQKHHKKDIEWMAKNKDTDMSTEKFLDMILVKAEPKIEASPFACSKCGLDCGSEEELAEHARIEHRSHKCLFCNKMFAQKYALENHLYVHTDTRKHSCSQCSLSFKRQIDLLNHVKRTHAKTEVVFYHCDKCSYTSRNRFAIKIHLLAHDGIAVYSCDECGKSFNSKMDLSTHKNNHVGFKPFQCDICGNSFTRGPYLKQHRKMVHENPHSFKCDVCGRGFSLKSTLKNHLKRHTGENKHYTCDICGRTMSSRISLINHQRIHSGDKRFSCNICGKAYVTKLQVKRHAYVHTGNKPFKCDVCNKQLATGSSLVKHLQTHWENRILYSCDICHKSYISKYKLKAHISNHHGDRSTLSEM